MTSACPEDVSRPMARRGMGAWVPGRGRVESLSHWNEQGCRGSDMMVPRDMVGGGSGMYEKLVAAVEA
jgi:hypothetical protein